MDDTRPAVRIYVPTFTRPAAWPPVQAPPVPFEAVRTMTAEALHELGCTYWDEADADGRSLVLFPVEWCEAIPEGFEVETISGRSGTTFSRETTDRDTRFGAVAFGVRVPRGGGKAGV